ncbi:MAG: hypothetical protein AAFV32_09900 [Myxococcota bacterium]
MTNPTGIDPSRRQRIDRDVVGDVLRDAASETVRDGPVRVPGAVASPPGDRGVQSGGTAELFPNGHSNGKGADVRRYIAAAQRGAGGQMPELQPNAAAGASGDSSARDVFSYTKRELASLPRDASPELVRLAMDAIIESLVNDATWPQPLVAGQEAHVGPGFQRPLARVEQDGQQVLVPKERESVQAWVDGGGLDGFRNGLRDFARAIHRRFPEGHPQRATALAAGYEAFAAKFYVHGGQVPYARMGTDRDGIDWADLVTIPHGAVTLDNAEIRTRIDCLGYDMLAVEFFEAAGLQTHSTTSMLGNMLNAHRQGIAIGGSTQLGFSNGRAFVLPAPSSGELGSTFLDLVREQLGRPSLMFSPEVFDSAAVRMRAESRQGRRR